MKKLKISEDKRHIITEDNTPFFWLGDTAWELFHRLDREQVVSYLKNRKEKGFTVIQAVVLAELDGLRSPNAYGHLPLDNLDPACPVEAYFEHVDYIVNKAEEFGLYIGMLPTWGDKYDLEWGVGPEIFTPENAKIYGSFLGKRYKDKPIIWIMGGDRNPENEEDYAIIRNMAEAIRYENGGTQLMTYHPRGGSHSSYFFHNDSWLDINMFQSGHGYGNFPRNYLETEHDYHLEPVKPVVDGEPCYEDHPINFKPVNGWFDDFDVRRAAYFSMLAGACGHTYGNHNIWQMWGTGHTPITVPRTPWNQAVDYPGAFQMGHMRRIFEARDWQSLLPAQYLILDGPDAFGLEIRAALSSNHNFLMAYIPYGSKITISLKELEAEKVHAEWINPKDGNKIELGEFNNTGSQEFKPPFDQSRGNDWVLIAERA